jgi:hypothetical protein
MVAAVTLSGGGPGTYPHRYAAGKRQFEEALGCRVIETRHALRDAALIASNPKGSRPKLVVRLRQRRRRGNLGRQSDAMITRRILDAVAELERPSPRVRTRARRSAQSGPAASALEPNRSTYWSRSTNRHSASARCPMAMHTIGE